MNKKFYDWDPFNDQRCIEAYIEQDYADFYEFAEKWFEDQLEAQKEFDRELNEDR